MSDANGYDMWPALPYEEFLSTSHLLRRCLQLVGKLKLTTPFEPHWANVALWLTSRGLTSGLIPYGKGCFSIDFDFISHETIFSTTWGKVEKIKLAPMSVAQYTQNFLEVMQRLDLNLKINMMPQEIPDAVAFDKDTDQREYNSALANAWWRILISSYRVLQRYHARFTGSTPPIGLMWGTFDLRDARYVSGKVPNMENAGFIERNAYDVPQVEAGWWSGDPTYTRAAFYNLIFPLPEKIETIHIKPEKARWDATKKIFVLDYDDLRVSKDPENELFTFFESTYKLGAQLAGWDSKLVTTGEPV